MNRPVNSLDGDRPLKRYVVNFWPTIVVELLFGRLWRPFILGLQLKPPIAGDTSLRSASGTCPEDMQTTP